MDDDDPWRGWPIAVAAFLIAVPALWIIARAMSVGWPDALGFPAGLGSTFWVGFWSSGFPPILAGAVAALVVGRYISDREYKRQDRELSERYEREIRVFSNRVSRLWRGGFPMLVVESLQASAPAPAQRIYDRLEDVQIEEWRAHTSGHEQLFVAIDDFSKAYDMFLSYAESFDSFMDYTIAAQWRVQRHARPVPDIVPLSDQRDRDLAVSLSQRTMKRYAIDIMREIQAESLPVRLNLDRWEQGAYARMWDLLASKEGVAVGIKSYRELWDGLVKATQDLHTQATS